MAFAAISSFVFLSNFSVASVTPGFEQIIETFDITVTQAGYLITVQILVLGLGVSELLSLSRSNSGRANDRT